MEASSMDNQCILIWCIMLIETLHQTPNTATHACSLEVSGLTKAKQLWVKKQRMVTTANTQTLFSLLFGKPTLKTMDQKVPELISHLMRISLTNKFSKDWMIALSSLIKKMMTKTINQISSFKMVRNQSLVLSVIPLGILKISKKDILFLLLMEQKLIHQKQLKLYQDGLGATHGRSNLSSLKELGAILELISQRNTVEVFSLTTLRIAQILTLC